MKIGIVGMPNAGKTTLFNALTQAGASTASYPFTTVDPNVAVVDVPDDRLARVAATIGATPVIYDTIEFHDIAGLVRGAHAGEGLGNQFLGSIRETDAICHVVRTHTDDGVPHPDGKVEPVDDVELIEAELLLADLAQAETRLARVKKQAGSGEKAVVAERDWLAEVVEALQQGEPVRSVPAPPDAAGAEVRLHALTSKPILYVANVDEGAIEPPPEIAVRAREAGAVAVALSARIESDLAELPEAEAAELREGLGLSESGLQRVIQAAYELLDLVTFFTADEGREARAHSLPRGGTAWEAAGRVHGEIQAQFVRAEAIGWDELVDAGGYVSASEQAKLRTEGRDYVVADGDVIHIRT
jgi:GTP-binding protein YchF